MSTLITKW
jgi:hypothetical protein